MSSGTVSSAADTLSGHPSRSRSTVVHEEHTVVSDTSGSLRPPRRLDEDRRIFGKYLDTRPVTWLTSDMTHELDRCPTCEGIGYVLRPTVRGLYGVQEPVRPITYTDADDGCVEILCPTCGRGDADTICSDDSPFRTYDLDRYDD